VLDAIDLVIAPPSKTTRLRSVRPIWSASTGPSQTERPFGGHTVTNDELGRLADANLALTWSTFGRTGGAAVAEHGRLGLVATGIPVAFFNGAYATGPTDDAEASVQGAIDFMHGNDVPWLLWVRAGVDDDLLEAGRRAGLRDAGGPPCMGLFPIPEAPRLPDRLEIELVTDTSGIDTHVDLGARGFEMPIEILRQLVNENTLAEPDLAIVVGSVDGVPVSTALVSVTGTTAGIYTVATPPEHRRHGYGAALTWAAVAEGARRGCDHAILQASPAGQPVYETMGFTHLGNYTQLEGPPAADA
jgi:GNAT superfamily N-acetyltransferase